MVCVSNDYLSRDIDGLEFDAPVAGLEGRPFFKAEVSADKRLGGSTGGRGESSDESSAKWFLGIKLR